MKSQASQAGVTLVELMIVVIIVGLLAAVALPSYRSHVISAGRTEGAGLLMEVMAQQESSYRSNLTYTTSLTSLGYASDPVDSETNLYKVSAEACGTTALTRCVLLRATPQGTQEVDGDLTLDSKSNKTGNWP